MRRGSSLEDKILNLIYEGGWDYDYEYDGPKNINCWITGCYDKSVVTDLIYTIGHEVLEYAIGDKAIGNTINDTIEEFITVNRIADAIKSLED